MSDNEQDNRRDSSDERDRERDQDDRRDDRREDDNREGRDEDANNNEEGEKKRDGPTTSLLVRNIAFGLRSDDVRKLFADFGEIRDVYIPLVSCMENKYKYDIFTNLIFVS